MFTDDAKQDWLLLNLSYLTTLLESAHLQEFDNNDHLSLPKFNSIC